MGSEIGVVVGMAAEARIARRLGWRVAVGGGTTMGAEIAAQQLIKDGARALISCGLAGGLDLALRAGTVIVPSAVIDGGRVYPTDPNLSSRLGGPMADLVVGARAIAATVAEKRRLRSETGAVAIDLESGAVARAADANGIPFAVLRAICDPAERSLPPAALAALDTRGAIGVRRVLASILSHPMQIPTVVVLGTEAAMARRALLAWIKRIAPEQTQPATG